MDQASQAEVRGLSLSQPSPQLTSLGHLAVRASAGGWVNAIGLDASAYCTHSLLLGGAALGFTLRRSQQDANGGAK